MQVLLNTDNQITGDLRLTGIVETAIQDAVIHFEDQVTRVEVHLNDVNSGKSGPDDHRCMIEARIKGHEPLAVTHHAESLMLALDGATEKLKAAVERLLGRLERR